jgi:hypothetical protein
MVWISTFIWLCIYEICAYSICFESHYVVVSVYSYLGGPKLESTSETRYSDRFLLWFEVLTAVVMKSSVFWDITPCNPLSVNRRFGGTYRLHLQGRRISQASSACHLLSSWFLAWLILRPWRWRRHAPPKRQLDFQLSTWRYIPEDRTVHISCIFLIHLRY